MKLNVRGDLYLANQEQDQLIFYKQLNQWQQERSEDKIRGIVTGDLDETSVNTPDFLFKPDFIQPIAATGDTSVLTLVYKDQLKKSQPVDFAYEVTVAILYLEKHPEIEKIADPVKRKEAYERAVRETTLGFEG